MNVVLTNTVNVKDVANKQFHEILLYPAMVVPGMEIEEIEMTLIQAILEYLDGKLSLEILIALATTMNQFSGMREKPYTDIRDALWAVGTLPETIDQQQPDTKVRQEQINDILVTTLDTLRANNHIEEPYNQKEPRNLLNRAVV